MGVSENRGAGYAGPAALRCVVLRGAGDKAFAAGADITEFETVRADAMGAKAYGDLVTEVVELIADCRHPTVALIMGVCIGGGLEIATACDLRICGESARFGIPINRLGLVAGYPEMKLLIDLVGPAYAKEILFTAHRFTAQEAYAMGLVNRVVAVDELEEVVRTMAATMADNAPLTLRSAKVIVAEALKDPADRDLERCDALVKACMTSNDYVEGRRAFMEKRKPEFTGT